MVLKKIISYLKDYLRNELKPGYGLSILLFISAFIFFEYQFDLKNQIELTFHNPKISFLLQFAIYWLAFSAAFLMHSWWYKDWKKWRNSGFYFLLFFSPLVFASRTLINNFSSEIYALIPDAKTEFFYYRCIAVLFRDLIIALPIVIYWQMKDRNNMPLYGFTLKNYDVKPYLMLLALMIPLTLLASMHSSFLHQYPKGFSLAPLSIDHLDERKYFYIYELFYGFDFIFIEFFFRGFLLLAFFRAFGWSCLLPMACFYVSIHFGKPLGETISSFFGGSILGIIAIRTGSIAGGIIVHLGVAWLMEIFALYQKLS